MKQPKKKYSFTTKGISGDVAGDFAKKTSKTIENLPQFNYRGKDAFKASLSKGPNATPQVSFTKGENRKLPYLSSRFETDVPRTNQMKTNGRPDDRSQTYSGQRSGGIGSSSNARTKSEDRKNLEDQLAKQAISGNPEYLKSQEKAAKESSVIGKNLKKAMSSGDEATLKNAVTQANTSTLNSKNYSLKRDPKGVENDASFQNRAMINAFDTATKDASVAQDFADYSRGLKGRLNTLKADLSRGFGTPSDERSGSESNTQPTVKPKSNTQPTVKPVSKRKPHSSQNKKRARVQEDFD